MREDCPHVSCLLDVSSDPELVELELVETKELAGIWGTVFVIGSICVSIGSRGVIGDGNDDGGD